MTNARESPVNPENFDVVDSFLVEGSTLDLGAGSIDYYDHTVDVDKDYDPDTVWNLEKTPLPFEEDSFENVVAIHVLEHLNKDLDLLEDMKRVASKTVVVMVPVGERPADDDHVRELDKSEWLERYNPDYTGLSSMGPYWDLACVWKTF